MKNRRSLEALPVLLLAWAAPTLFLVMQPAYGSVHIHLLIHGLLAIAAIFALTALGWWRKAGFCCPYRWSSLGMAAVPLLLIVAAYNGVGFAASHEAVLYGGLALLTAFQEEAWLRGLLLHPLTQRYGTWPGAMLSALIAGGVYLGATLGGADPVVTLIWVAGTVLTSLGFAGLRVRTGTLWPGVVINAALTFTLFAGRGGLVAKSAVSPYYLLMRGISLVAVGLWAAQTLRREERAVGTEQTAI